MENCYIKSLTNPGADSELYKFLYDNMTSGVVGSPEREAAANELWSHFLTTEFMRQFGGDWIKDYKDTHKAQEEGRKHTPVISQMRVNSIGEPRLFTDEESGRYYYLTKYNQRRYFPLEQAGILDIFSHADVLEVAKVLALDYVTKYTNLSFENIKLSGITETLYNSISEKLNSKIRDYTKELNALEALTEREEWQDQDIVWLRRQISKIESTLPYIPEWQEYVEDFFREIKMVYSEDDNTDDVIREQDENNRDRAFDTASWEYGTKQGISANVKLRLSLLQDENEKDSVFNEPIFLSFDDVYGDLLEHLNSTVSVYKDGYREDVFKLQVNAIENLGRKKGYFKDLANFLRRPDLSDDIKNEFFQAFNVDKNHFITTEIKVVEQERTRRKTRFFTVMDLTNVGSKGKMIEAEWYANFGEKFLNKGDNLTPEAVSFISEILNGPPDKPQLGIISLNQRVKNAVDQGKGSDKAYVEKVANFLIEKWQDLGIELDESGDGFAYFLDLLNEEDHGKALVQAFDATEVILEGILSGSIAVKTSPFSDQRLFTKLADAEAFFLPEGADASIFAGAKSKWIYSYPSYLSTKIKEWKKDQTQLRDMLNTVNGRSSEFIRYLLGEDLVDVDDAYKNTIVQERIENFHLTIFNSYQEESDATNADDYKNIKKNDFYADSYNKILMSKPHYSTPVPADKGSLYQLQIDYKVQANARGNKEKGYKVNQKVLDIFYEYFRSEYDRISQVYKEIQDNLDEEGKPIDKNLFRMYYHGKWAKDGTWDWKSANGLKSQIFPSMDFGKFDAEKAGYELYGENGEPIATLVSSREDIESELKDKIQASIKPLIIKKILDTQAKMFQKGILEFGEDGSILNNGLDQNIFTKYEGDPLALAGDIFVNGFISQVEFSKMFSGDVAYYKNTVDYKKRVPETYTDGLGLRLFKEDDEFFNIAVVENIERSSPYYEQLVEMLGEDLAKNYLDGINSADAQAWITPQRWRFLLQRMGKWNEKYQSVYHKMISGKADQGLEPEELKMVAQPLKGVYFEINNGVPTYLKYSQAVLVPDLVKGTSLEEMYKKMIYNEDGSKKKFKDQIHEVVTLDGMKVGPTVPDLIHDGKGGFKKDAILTPLQLKNSGWKLQQNLPTKTFKPTDIGSQLEKNIYGGLSNNLDETFMVDDEEMSGQELIDHINNIMNALRDKGRARLALQFGITPTGKIQNYSRVYSALIDDLRSRKSGNRNVIDALKANMSPYGIPSAQKTLMNIFASIFTRDLVKVKTNGGAFIQMSNFGISKREGDRRGIIWSPKLKEGDTPSEPKFLKDEKGEFVLSKSGKKIVQPGQVILSGSFIAKYIPDYRKYTADQLFGKWDAKNRRYKGGMIDSRILQGAIGYRIPNQALASNDALEIVGILPEEMGDTVIAYTGITTKTGSDFDIDKMYMMMPEIKPIRKNAKALRDYAFQELRGKNYRETIDNIKEVIGELSPETLEEFEDLEPSVEGLSKKMAGKVELETAKEAADLMVEMVMYDKEIKKSPFAVRLKEIAGTHEIVKLGYVEPERGKIKRSAVDENGKLVEVEVDGNKPYQDQTKQALANMLMKAYQAVLTHPEVIKEVMTPIDFPFIKDNINLLHKKPPVSDLDVFDVSEDIELKYEFMAGKAGVGMEANAYVDHMRGTMAEMTINDYYIGWGNAKNGETVLDREYSSDLSPADLAYYLEEINKGRKPEDFVTEESFKRVKISYSLSAVLNAFVDIAKDPYITRGNWTTQTTNVGNFMLRAGVHPAIVNAYLGQPILKEYVDYVTNKESKIISESGDLKDKFRLQLVRDELKKMGGTITWGKEVLTYEEIYSALVKTGPKEQTGKVKRRDSAIAKVTPEAIAGLFKYKGTVDAEIRDILASHIVKIEDAHKSVFSPAKVKVSDMSLQDMHEQITGKKDPNMQLAILNDFFELQKITKELRNSIAASKSDVNGPGKNISSLTVLINNIRKLLGDEPDRAGKLKGFRQKLIKDGKKTVLGGITENMMWLQKVMQANPFFFLMSNPYIVNTFNEISRDVHDDILTNEDLGTKLEGQYYSYMMSNFKPLQFENEGELSELVFKFPKQLRKWRKDLDIQKGDYPILDELRGRRSPGGTLYLAMSNRKKSPQEQSEIIASWMDLLNDYPEIGEKLIKYSYATTGFNMTISQFFTYIPHQWFLRHNIDHHILEMNDDMNKINQSGDAVDEVFLEQVYLNNVEDNQLVPQVYPSMMGEDYGNAGFVLAKKGKARRYMKKITTSKQPNPETGAKDTRVSLFKLVGYTKGDRGIYIQSTKLGMVAPKGIKVYEYMYDADIESEFVPNFLTGSKWSIVDGQKVRTISQEVAENRDMLQEAAVKTVFANDTKVVLGDIDFEKEVDELTC